MENKKTKLTISGKPKKIFKDFENKKSQGKNTVIIDKQTKKGNFINHLVQNLHHQVSKDLIQNQF